MFCSKVNKIYIKLIFNIDLQVKNLNNMTEEVWKPILGYENIYEVSNFGNVRSNRLSGRILKPANNGGGYLQVVLCDGSGGMKHKQCHRLTALSFISNPNNYTDIDHIDAVKTNNRVENLRWVTKSMNTILRKPMKRKYDLPRGVYKSGNKFVARMQIDGKNKHLGTFETPEQASICFEAKRKQKLNEDGLYNNLN